MLSLALLLACAPVTVLDDPATGPQTGPGEGFTPDVDDDDDGGPDTAGGTEHVPGFAYEHMPVFFIDADGSIGSGDKTAATLQVIAEHDGTHGDLDDAIRSWSGPIGIQVHGSSSQGYDKLGYRFETRDDSGEDLNVEMLGLPEGSDWVLHGPYADKTLLRNAFAYSLARELAQDRDAYEVRTRFVEMYLNGSYWGVYLLVERVKRGSERLGLPAPAATSSEGDITGGYIVKIDQNRGDGWSTARGSLVDYAYPRYDDITPQQDAYIRGWFEDFEAAVAADFTAETYGQWIDPTSFVDHFILNELSHNIDAYRLSAYLHKVPDDQGGLLYAGPVWDFDRAYGNVNYCDSWETHGFIIDSLTDCGYSYQYPFWWPALVQDDDFQGQLRCRWEELRTGDGVLGDDRLEARFLTLVDEVAEAEVRDHARWDTLGEYVDPNYYVGETWDDELEWMLDWTLDRAAWLDVAMPGTCERR